VEERDDDGRLARLEVELTHACDHDCAHCYNVWTARDGDPQGGLDTTGQLPTPELLSMLDKVVAETGVRSISFTGGEPLLRKDALEIIAHACTLVESVHLVTNGSHLPPAVAAKLAEVGVKSVQLTLLSADREQHDRLKGAKCFDDTVRAILDLQEAGVRPQVCFVAMRENCDAFESVLELCLVLDVKGVSYNRMSPAGGAIHHIARLMPTVEQVEANLDTAERLGEAWQIRVTTAMPIPPCLIRIERYRWLRFGFCSTGSRSPNTVLDAAGNVRSCNLSSTILGNVLRQSFAEIEENPYPHEFRRSVPEMCLGCIHERSCGGGCKEAAFAAFADRTHPEPFVSAALDRGAGEA
jgi:pyrroloquinoline quinone biosynthesis protein E